MKRSYLGDSVYVEYDGYQLWLITSDGKTDTNVIALNPDTYGALVAYVKCIFGTEVGERN